MPYIKQKDREKFESLLKELDKLNVNSSGELNYLLTMISMHYLNYKGLKYESVNDVLGAMEGSKLEFYRRVVAPYEDIKIEENGDI
jgi:hypothetical protein